MDDARKFLRYVAPGVIFGTLTLLWLFIVDPGVTSKIFGIIEESALGAALGGLLMSGGLGYILATIHHNWHAKYDEDILDHSPLIKSLGFCPDSREEALVISTALWCQMRDKEYIKDATFKKLESFGNQVHALGTARVASIFALMVAVMFSIPFGPSVNFIIMYLLGISVFIMFDLAYRRVGIFAQGVYDQIFYEAYDECLSKHASPQRNTGKKPEK